MEALLAQFAHKQKEEIMARRKAREDMLVETAEKMLDIILLNPTGKKARKDKKLGSLRKDWKKAKKGAKGR